VQVIGYAQSNARVSTLMRNIEASPWLTKPELVEVRLVPVPGGRPGDASRVSQFTLNFEVKRDTTNADTGAIPPKGAPKA
jgi:type IV pilus assembly protein PilN